MDTSTDSLDRLIDSLALLDHSVIPSQRFDYVYRPNDDTGLLFDALKQEIYTIMALDPEYIVEIGSGSGAVINSLQKMMVTLEHESSTYFATDLNYDANEVTREMARQHGLEVHVVNTSILSGLRHRGIFDIVICNPPYVPTEQEELDRALGYIREKDSLVREGRLEEARLVNCIDVSYAGGFQGMTVTWQMIEAGLEALSPRGIFYLLLIQDNDLKNTLDKVGERGFSCRVVRKKRFHNELIYIFGITRPRE